MPLKQGCGTATTCGPWASLFVVQLSYCIWHVLGKKALNYGMSPYVLALYRQAGGACCMAVLSHIVDGNAGVLSLPKRCRSLARFDALRVAGLGALGFANIYGFIIALSYVTSFNSALLHPIIPVVSAVAAWATGVERLSMRKALGIFASAVGAFVVVVFGVRSDHNTEGGDSSGHRILVGNAFLLGQCVAMGCLLVLQKALLTATGVPPTTLTLVYNIIAMIPAVVATLILVDPTESGAYSLKRPIELGATLYGAVFGICFIYTLLTWATSKIGPSAVSLSMTLQGPLNAVLACLFLDRRSFTIGEVGGGTLIVVGLVVTVLDTGAADPPPAAAAANDGTRLVVDDDQQEVRLSPLEYHSRGDNSVRQDYAHLVQSDEMQSDAEHTKHVV